MADASVSEPILHVDLDAFYASVETLKDPSLKGKPVVVGGAGNRGVVMSASYEARTYGIRSAMPGVRARRLCPDAIFVPPDFEAYQAHSNRFREVLLSFTPVVEPISLDEAFLDVSGAHLLFGTSDAIGRRIRRDVLEHVGVICSVGVAPNKLLAKLASEAAKPDGMVVVRTGEVDAFLSPLPARALWGVGEKTMEVLTRLGVRTVGDLARTPEAVLGRLIGEHHGRDLIALARGQDLRSVVPYEAPKSVSHEETFDRDLDADAELLREILALSQKVAARLREDGYRARTITLKVRLANFTTLTRSRTIDPTDVGADVHAVAADLFRALPGARRRVRLLGVGASGLTPAGEEQLALLRGERWGDVERAVDRIEKRFGSGAAMPAALLDRRMHRAPAPDTSPGTRPKR
ncbi:MAG TPA: DNA polymerase IV [Actinomycetota bacterium]|jgi:DNA polymerase-4|nr:DNA polymerase IV [Actinomycetota bacterium]